MQSKGKAKAWKPFVVRRPIATGLAIAILVFLLLSVFRRLSSDKKNAIIRPQEQYFDDFNQGTSYNVDKSSVNYLDFALSRHMYNVLQHMGNEELTCLQESCSNEISKCRDDKNCRIALRHFSRQCWTTENLVCDELVNVGLIPECPKAFDAFFQCYSATCSRDRSSVVDHRKPYYLEDARDRFSDAELLALTAEIRQSLIDSDGHELHLETEISHSAVEKVISAAKEADERSGWGVWTALNRVGKVDPVLYSAEVHSYHHDNASPRLSRKTLQENNGTFALLTVAFALPTRDSTNEVELLIRAASPCGPKRPYKIYPGGMLIFESWRDFDFLPSHEERHILIIDLWERDSHDGFDLWSLNHALWDSKQRGRQWLGKRLTRKAKT